MSLRPLCPPGLPEGPHADRAEGQCRFVDDDHDVFEFELVKVDSFGDGGAGAVHVGHRLGEQATVSRDQAVEHASAEACFDARDAVSIRQAFQDHEPGVVAGLGVFGSGIALSRRSGAW